MRLSQGVPLISHNWDTLKHWQNYNIGVGREWESNLLQMAAQLFQCTSLTLAALPQIFTQLCYQNFPTLFSCNLYISSWSGLKDWAMVNNWYISDIDQYLHQFISCFHGLTWHHYWSLLCRDTEGIMQVPQKSADMFFVGPLFTGVRNRAFLWLLLVLLEPPVAALSVK